MNEIITAQSPNDDPRFGKTPRPEAPHNILGPLPNACDIEAQIPLLTLVRLIESKTFRMDTVRNLAGTETSPLAHQLKALCGLWVSLGRPDNIFWRASCVCVTIALLMLLIRRRHNFKFLSFAVRRIKP
jgi:hypothetical protein